MWESTPMRRKDRLLPTEEAEKLLAGAEYGILASASGEGVPLATPLNFVYAGGNIYFHSAKQGQKLRNIAAQPRVSFCVVGKTQPVYEDGHFTTSYESAVVKGKAGFVEEGAEKTKILLALCQKYLPAHMDKADDYIAKGLAATCVVRVEIEQLAGKARRGGSVG